MFLTVRLLTFRVFVVYTGLAKKVSTCSGQQAAQAGQMPPSYLMCKEGKEDRYSHIGTAFHDKRCFNSNAFNDFEAVCPLGSEAQPGFLSECVR